MILSAMTIFLISSRYNSRLRLSFISPTNGSERPKHPTTRRATAMKKIHHAATQTTLDVRLVGKC
jgi:hypothetical protein